MLTQDFARLQRVHDQADVAVFGKPGGVMLVGDLRAVGDAVDDGRAVAADVEDRWRRELRFLGDVKVGRDVQAGNRLEVQLLDGEVLAVDGAGDDGLEVGAREAAAKGPSSPKTGGAVPGRFLLPVGFCLDVGKAGVGDFLSFAGESKRRASCRRGGCRRPVRRQWRGQ